MVLHVANDKSKAEKIRFKGYNNLPFYIVLSLCFIGGMIGNKKFFDFLRFVDFNTFDILTKNVFEYFSDLHHFSINEVRRR